MTLDPITQPWDHLPDEQKLEMMLEMLVDDELPQTQRATLLRSLDAMPRQWRTLALRFLERQAEHTSVRQFISAATATPVPAGHSFSSPKKWPVLRVAAGLAILAGLSAIVLSTMQNKTATAPVVATEVLPISGNIMGTANKADVPVNLVKTQDFPAALLQGTLSNNSSRTLFIVPQGPDNAAVIPVTTAKEEVIY